MLTEMHGSTPGGMSSFQELAPQAFAWTNKWGQKAKERVGTRTLSAVPSSRRSKKHEAAMILALLS
jgi:hypothetical protein